MCNLTVQQLHAVKGNIRFLQEKLRGYPITAEKIADMIVYLSDQEDWEEVREYCEKSEKGRICFLQTYHTCCQNTEPISIRRIFLCITENMGEIQKKGFCLHSYECMRQMHVKQGIVGPADTLPSFRLAGEAEAVLGKKIEEQMEKTARLLLSQTVYRQAHMLKEGRSDRCEPLIMAGAVYITVLQGDLPIEFQKYPELLGACAEAWNTIHEEVAAREKKDREQKFQTAVGIIAVLMGISIRSFMIPEISFAHQNMTGAVSHSSFWRGRRGIAVIYIKPFLQLQLAFGTVSGLCSTRMVFDPILDLQKFYTDLVSSYESKAGLGIGETGFKDRTEQMHWTEDGSWEEQRVEEERQKEIERHR